MRGLLKLVADRAVSYHARVLKIKFIRELEQQTRKRLRVRQESCEIEVVVIWGVTHKTEGGAWTSNCVFCIL